MRLTCVVLPITTQLITLQREPADMSEHDWNVVMLNNSLLHGMVYDPESKSLQPARDPGKSNLKHGCLSYRSYL